MSNTIVVTGGAGFIGSNFVRVILEKTDARVAVLDKLTYAGNLANLADISENSRFEFFKGDIADKDAVRTVFEKYDPESIINFAAESHVDRSIDNPAAFIDTNIVGTFVLLEESRHYWSKRGLEDRDRFRFIQISTDEVYGSLGETGYFTEETPVAPNSPYSASKASADHLARSYHKTYGLPVIVTNCSNNYGPLQFPEKLIPLMVLNALEGKSLPLYSDGSNIRDWLYVEDHCTGILQVLEEGIPGESYNLGGGCEKTNLEIVDGICRVLESLRPARNNQALRNTGVEHYSDLKAFVKDRPGHDRRYAIDYSKVTRELGWKPANDFESGLTKTIEWYLAHLDWCDTVQSRGYRRERLGLSSEQVLVKGADQ